MKALDPIEFNAVSAAVAAGARKKVRLGDMLVATGLITDAQLQSALAEQKRSGRR